MHEKIPDGKMGEKGPRILLSNENIINRVAMIEEKIRQSDFKINANPNIIILNQIS